MNLILEHSKLYFIKNLKTPQNNISVLKKGGFIISKSFDISKGIKNVFPSSMHLFTTTNIF